LLENLFGFVFEHRPANFDPMGAFREHVGAVLEKMFRVVLRQCIEVLTAQTVDDAPDATPKDRSRAHRAGLGAGIHRGVRKQRAGISARGFMQ